MNNVTGERILLMLLKKWTILGSKKLNLPKTILSPIPTTKDEEMILSFLGGMINNNLHNNKGFKGKIFSLGSLTISPGISIRRGTQINKEIRDTNPLI